MPRIDLEPIHLELEGDERREVAYTLGSEILLRERGYAGQRIVEKMEEKTPDGKDQYRVNYVVFCEYLFAVLQRDARAKGLLLKRHDVEEMITRDSDISVALDAINRALGRFYGKAEQAEAKVGEAALPSQARRRGSKSRSK